MKLFRDAGREAGTRLRQQMSVVAKPRAAGANTMVTDAGTGTPSIFAQAGRRAGEALRAAQEAKSPARPMRMAEPAAQTPSQILARKSAAKASQPYEGYRDAHRQYSKLKKEYDQRRRKFSQEWEWRDAPEKLPGYAQAKDHLDELRKRMQDALSYMGAHTSDLAEDGGSIRIDGDAGGHAERLAKKRQERDAYAESGKADPDRLLQKDKELAKWQKAVDDATARQQKDSFPLADAPKPSDIPQTQQMYDLVSWQPEADATESPLRLEYEQKQQERARLQTVLDEWDDVVDGNMEKQAAREAEYGTQIEIISRIDEIDFELSELAGPLADEQFAELGYAKWDGTEYTPESIPENWDRILALASLNVLSDTQKEEALSVASALRQYRRLRENRPEPPKGITYQDAEALEYLLNGKASGVAGAFATGFSGSFPFGEKLQTAYYQQQADAGILSDDVAQLIDGYSRFQDAKGRYPGGYLIGSTVGNLVQMLAAGQVVGAATAGAEAAIGAAELSPLADWFANAGLNAARTGTTMATVTGLQSAGNQDWSDPGTAARNTAIDTGIAAAGGIVGSAASALSSTGVQEILIRNGWQTAFGEFVRNTLGSTAFTTGNAVTDHVLKTAAADRYGESYGEAPTAQDLGQSIMQGFLFSLISSGIETAASTAAAKAEMNADVAALQQDLTALMGEIDTEDAASVDRFVEDAYQRIVALEDKIGSNYYAGQQEAVDNALKSLDELSRMIAEDFPSNATGTEVPPFDETGSVPEVLDPPASSGYNGGGQTPPTADAADAVYNGTHRFADIELPTNDSQLKHIFADRPGHVPDTTENRQMLLDFARDPQYYKGDDGYGNSWSYTELEDGRQMWVRYRDGVINEGGINPAPKPWDEKTGLNENPKANGTYRRKPIISTTWRRRK